MTTLNSTHIPEAIKVDPCTAMAEWMKSEVPSTSPAPVFSTMALIHGKDAIGAIRIKNGFSFNPEMDLLWALGFPKVAFIVDGFPAEDTMEALLKIYDPERRWTRWSNVQGKTGIIYTRRGAFARLYECLPPSDDPEVADSVLEFDDEENFLDCTTPTEVTKKEVTTTLKGSCQSARIDEDALLLEALAGPDIVIEGLLELLEEKAYEGTLTNTFKIVWAMIPIGLRLTKAGHEQACQRLEKWFKANPDSEIENTIKWFINSESAAEMLLKEKGEIGISKRPFLLNLPHWEEQIMKEYTDRGRRSIPKTGDAFVGNTTEILKLDQEFIKKYSVGEAADIFIEELSACSNIEVVPLMLHVADKQDRFKKPILAWLNAHQSTLNAYLESLPKEKSNKLTKKIEALESPEPSEAKQENKNAIWEDTIEEIEKLQPVFLNKWKNEEELEKAFLDTLEKCRIIAEKHERTSDEHEIFINAWAEANFDKLSKEQYTKLSELYDELVYDFFV